MKDCRPEPMGGAGKVVEADETYFGKRENPARLNSAGPPLHQARQARPRSKRAVVGPGRARRAGPHVPCRACDGRQRSANRGSQRHPRKRSAYRRKPPLHRARPRICRARHRQSHSASEYVRGDWSHTNTVENVFLSVQARHARRLSALRRSALAPLPCRFDFRYNRRSAFGVTDTERTEDVAKGTEGKRLTYRPIDKTQVA